MLKFLKISFVIILLLVIALGAGGWYYLKSLVPQNSGTVSLKGLQSGVEVYFDTYNIPHIYANNQQDAYYSLGYVHAQERLFQMELMRRAGAGRLSEILGEDLVNVDKFFRTLGIAAKADELTQTFFATDTAQYQQAALAYIKGINAYLENGKTPIEFTLLQIPKEKFSVRDIYLVVGLMSYQFANAFKSEPVMSYIHQNLGKQYFDDLATGGFAGEFTLKNCIPASFDSLKKDSTKISQNYRAELYTPIAQAIHQIIDGQNIIQPFTGSNAWILSPRLTKNKKVLFCNDTHIGFSQPSVWFEAHLYAPDFELYGNFLAGLPFAPVGHNRAAAWGMTMFENDDIDLYAEKQNPDNKNQFWENDKWVDCKIRKEIIKVKDKADIQLDIQETRHGAIVNAVLDDLKSAPPTAIWWTFTKTQNRILEAAWELNNMKTVEMCRSAASKVGAPGLNIMYGDSAGNIAWFASALLPIRPAHVNPALILDGASGKDDVLGFYDFSKNPQCVNPASGYLYSANNQPDTIGNIFHHGYYISDNRARRIHELLNTNKTDWTVEDMKTMLMDNKSPRAIEHNALLVSVLQKAALITENEKQGLQILEKWEGDYPINAIAPSIYTRTLENFVNLAAGDELGENMKSYFFTHFWDKSLTQWLKNENSVWWDNIKTKDKKETRNDLIIKAYQDAIADLEKTLGEDAKHWTWGKLHTIEYAHALGAKKPLDKIFNVPARPTPGGMEVINNMSFKYKGEVSYKVSFGPAMRIVLDFAEVENSISINPTGQSGYFMSKHYDDQAQMFVDGKFRKQMMSRDEIEQTHIGRLVMRAE